MQGCTKGQESGGTVRIKLWEGKGALQREKIEKTNGVEEKNEGIEGREGLTSSG